MTATQFALLGLGPIATLMTIFGIVVVRGTKVSEFRQAWINDQRTDIAKLIANARRLDDGGGLKADEYWLAFDDAHTRVALRKNPNPRKKEWDDVLAEIAILRADLMPGAAVSGTSVGDRADEIVKLSRVWLKAEWTRVRFGEAGYRTLILLAAILIFWPVLPLLGYLLFHVLGLTQYLPAGLQIEAMLSSATGK